MTRRRLLAFCAILAVLSSMPLPATAAGAGVPNARSMAAAGARFASLDQAVTAGIVDSAVVSSLRSKGRVDAIATYLGNDALVAALKSTPAGRTRSEGVLAKARPVFAARKALAIQAAGRDAQVLSDWQNLASNHVRFRSERALLAFANARSVTGVREDVILEATLSESLPLIGRSSPTNPAEVGTGVSVAVLDTGLDYTRAAFGSCTSPGVPAATCKVPYARDFAPDDGRLDDYAPTGCAGPGQCHGTNVAGIVRGVAPGAKVLGLDVFHGSGSSSAYTNAAMNWIAGNQATYNIRAANLSLGTPSTYATATCYTSPFAPGFASLRAVGVLPVVASGNDAQRGPSYAFVNGISNPACAPGALSVGAVYDSNINPTYYACDGPVPTAADQITCFSQSASILGMLAPGAMINAAGITQGGTSQATPHAAGAAAVLAAARPTAGPYQIQRILEGSGDPILDDRNNVTKKRLDLPQALAMAVPPKPMWSDPALVVGPWVQPTWTYGNSLAQTVAGAIRYFHNAHTNVQTAPRLGVEYSRSTNDGANWASKRLNPTTKQGDFIQIASSGAYLYVAWIDWGVSSPYRRVINFRANTSNGAAASWQPLKAMTAATGYVDGPSIAASGTNVYLVWTDSTNGKVWFRRSRNRGATWDAAILVDTTTAVDSGHFGAAVNRSGRATVTAAGANVAVSWLDTAAGALKTRISRNSGTSFPAAITLDGNAKDGAGMAAVGQRIAFVWPDATNVRLREWLSGTLGALRNVTGFTAPYKAAYDAAVAVNGANTTEVVWAGCRLTNCAVGSSQGMDLMWRRTTNKGASWTSAATVLYSSTVNIARINDGTDIEFSTASRRHVAWNGWTPNVSTVTHMLNGR